MGSQSFYLEIISTLKVSPYLLDSRRKTVSSEKKTSFRDFLIVHTIVCQINNHLNLSFLPMSKKASKNPKTSKGGTSSTSNHRRISYQTGEIWLQEPNKWSVDSNFDESATYLVEVAEKYYHFLRGSSIPNFWKRSFFWSSNQNPCIII
jgi:hypothetical protein